MHQIDRNANGDALGQSHPGEDRINGRQPLSIGLRVRNIDAARDAVAPRVAHVGGTSLLRSVAAPMSGCLKAFRGCMDVWWSKRESLRAALVTAPNEADPAVGEASATS